MRLRECSDIDKLIRFLKIDYANNLYFFTYLSQSSVQQQENKILVGEIDGEIVVAILITPIHCAISSLGAYNIELVAAQIPPINSIHVVGRNDYVEKLLHLNKGPRRQKHDYTLCEMLPGISDHRRLPVATRASHEDLEELVWFYNHNDMLYDAQKRLPGILNWGKIYYVRGNGEIISCALTTTETEDAAMIGAVFTCPEFRNRGYARACLVELGRELLLQNKTPYLFYKSDNVMLAKFYGALGFRKIGDWILATKTR